MNSTFVRAGSLVLFLALTFLASSAYAALDTVPSEGQQCVGGTVVAFDNDYSDGVNFGMMPPDYYPQWCANIAPGGGCCSVQVEDRRGAPGGAYPEGVMSKIEVREGAHVETVTCGKRSFGGIFQTFYNCFVAQIPSQATNLTATLVANPTTIERGDQSLLSWGSTGATFCTGTNFDTNNTVSGSLLVSPSATTKYTLLCTNGTQDAQSIQIVTVTVDGEDPGNGDGGGGGGGDTGDGDPGDDGHGVCAAGPQCVGASLFYKNSDCSQTLMQQCVYGCALSACVNPPAANGPASSLLAEPPLIKKGAECTLALSAKKVSSCTLVGSGLNVTIAADANGLIATTTRKTAALFNSATYTLTCTGGQTKIIKTVDCKVTPTFTEF